MRGLVLAALTLFLSACVSKAQSQDAPGVTLAPQGDAVQLLIDGEPFLMLAGETGNSTASHLPEMEQHWETFQALNMNTVLAPIYWELLEPEEGVFDYTLIDGLVQQARAHEMKLVLLWFGTWKNSMSTYVPAWVKTDPERFPRARNAVGAAQDILSPHGENTLAADARAFTALLARLAEIDPVMDTVILVQVENEVGMLPDARDHSVPAEVAWNAPVPTELIEALIAGHPGFSVEVLALWQAQGAPVSGSWAEVFGDSDAAHEVFTAWGLARFCDRVAAAGKAAHDLPMYVNAALPRPGSTPGGYPSGGPLDHLFGVWQISAPSLDFLAPDIYFENYVEKIGAYKIPGNAVFIPEANRAGRGQAPADALWSFGEVDAIGFSPFSIENIGEENIEPLSETYSLIRELAPLILDHQGRDTMWGLRPNISYEGVVQLNGYQRTFGDFRARITFKDPWTPQEAQNGAEHGALIIETGENEFLVAGKGVTLTFEPIAPERGEVGILWAREGRYEAGKWIGESWLNGDQTHQGRHIRLPPDRLSVQRFKLYRYE